MRVSTALAAVVMMLSVQALADQRLNVNVPAGGAQDMLNMTTIPPEVSDSTGDPSMQRFCTNPSGRIVRQGQEGYDECLKLARGKKPTPAPSAADDHEIIIHTQSQ